MTTEQKVTRKLRAIMSADVKGYSILMADDEAGTVQTLKDYRNIMSVYIEQHGGRVVDAVGDNLLAEFDSAVDAVQCAVEVQKELKVKNQELPEDKRLEFRIGVNIGDVIQDGDSIFGDGVNIAARIEKLADAGGVCISRNIYNHIKKKLSLGYEFLGEHPVKNISEPVTVYKVLMDEKDAGKLIGVEKKASKKGWFWVAAAAVVVAVVGLGIWQFYMRRPAIEPASEEKMAFPLPDKPSIAVLAFDNLSGDPQQEYFSDGISEDIITALSKIPKMFVIARNSTFTYKGKPVKVQRVAEELGVRYVLEGSVRKAGEKVRITAQLIDAKTGHHLWAGKYDRELKDIFALQDEVTKSIIAELQVKLTEGEQARIRAKGTDSLEVYLKVIEARELVRAFNIEHNRKARKLLEEAIELDPNYAPAYRWLGSSHSVDVWMGASKSPGGSLKRAVELQKKALSIDSSLGDAHAVMGSIYILTKKYENGMSELEKAVELYPNGADANAYLAAGLLYTDKLDEAILISKKAIRFNPMAPSWYLNNLAAMYRSKGNYEEALVWSEKAVKQEPEYIIGRIHLSSIYALTGRMEEAYLQANEVMKLNPKFYVKGLEKTLPYKNAEVKKSYIAALRKAGLPYTPPLPLPDKPSIAVLAFDNLSGDPEQGYFSDGIAENIITALSKVGELFVIARNSSFTYKGKPVKVQQVSRELGVRYILEGSVQKSGDRVRITAQLIDAKNGQHLWAENYDRDFKDIFAIQDEITMKIVTALRVELTEGEHARIQAKNIKNPAVYLKVSQAMSLWNDGTTKSMTRYGQLAQEIVDMEPEYSVGYRLLGWYHWGLIWRGISPRENLKKAFGLSQKALAMDESDAFSHTALGFMYLLMRKYEKAIESGKRAVELQPNGAFFHCLYGSTLSFAGRVDEGIAHLKKSIRLNPFPAFFYYYHLGRSYRQKGHYEDALTELQKALQLAPNSAFMHVTLAMTYILLEREEEARASTAKALELDPHLTVTRISSTATYKNEAHLKLLLDAMRKAGFPE